MAGFGTKVNAIPRRAVLAKATPPSGASQEAIWDQRFDTQTYPTTGINSLVFFTATNADKTLSNMEAAGQFPAPQSFQIYNICADLYPQAASLSEVAVGAAPQTSVPGNVDDLQKILFQARPVWTLNISSKIYGPYSLTLLHGTGGPQGFLSGTYTAQNVVQHGRNEISEGWNYQGSIIIPEQTSFSITVTFQGTLVPVNAAHNIRLSLLGIQQRRVL